MNSFHEGEFCDVLISGVSSSIHSNTLFFLKKVNTTDTFVKFQVREFGFKLQNQLHVLK